MSRDLKQAARIAFPEAVRLLMAAFAAVGGLLPRMPWWSILAVWLIGAVITHVWLYRGLVGKPRLNDFGLYFQDSGVAMVILLWPAFVGFTFGPDWAQAKAERLVGIRWRDGERHFD